MNVHIDAAGYIVMTAALLFATAFGLAVFFGLKHGRRSKVAITWVANTGTATQLLGVAFACSSTTMPLTPLLIYLTLGIGLFFFGRKVKREAQNTKIPS